MLAVGLAVTHVRLGAVPREMWKDDPAISRAKISSFVFTNMVNDFCKTK